MTTVTVEVPQELYDAADAYAATSPRARVEIKRWRNNLNDAISAAETLGAESKARATVQEWILESDDPEPVAYREELDKWQHEIEKYTNAIERIKSQLNKAENDLIESRVKGSVNAEDSAAAVFEYDAAHAEFNRISKIVGEHVPSIKAFKLPTSTVLVTGRKVNPTGLNKDGSHGTSGKKFSFESITFDGEVLAATTFSGAALETKVGTPKMWASRLIHYSGTEQLVDGQQYEFKLGGEDGEKHSVVVVPTTKTRGRKPKSIESVSEAA